MKINKFKHNLMSEKSLQSCAEYGEFPPRFWLNFRQKKATPKRRFLRLLAVFAVTGG